MTASTPLRILSQVVGGRPIRTSHQKEVDVESKKARASWNLLYIFACISPPLLLLIIESCPTLWDPMDCSLPSSSVHGVLQARILEWVATSFSRGFSQPKYWTQVSCIAGRFFTVWVTREVTSGSPPLPDHKSLHIIICCCSVIQSRPTLCDPMGLQHASLTCPSPTPRACSNSSPLSLWCHPTISFSDVPFSSCLQSFPASGSFPVSRLFTSGHQSIEASASVLPMNIQDQCPLGLTG